MSDLLEMETQFRVLNMELESKTKDLLRRADDIVRTQELVIPRKKSPVPMPIEPQINVLRYTWQSDDSDNYNYLNGDNFNGLSKQQQAVEDLQSVKQRINHDMSTELPPENTQNDSTPLPTLNETKSKESFDSCSESFKSEDDNPIEDMMRTFNSQKEFSVTLDDMLSYKKKKKRSHVIHPVDYFPRIENGLTKVRSVNFNEMGSLNDVSYHYVKSKISPADNTIVQALRKRLATLEDEIQKCQENLRKKASEFDGLMKANQSVEDNKVRLSGQVNSLKTQLVKMETKIASLQSKLQLKETECRGLKSEKESLIRTAKEAAQGTCGSEVRLARSREEIQTLKTSLNTIRAQEKEIRESAKQQVDELKHALGRSEKREREAMATVRKQALLIDNLKRQVNILETKQQVQQIDKQLDEVVKWRHKKL